MLYLLAAKYIFGGGNQLPVMVSKLSGTTKNFTAGLMSDPQKMENLIGMVRTVAPLTSAHTVTKVNTYLPLFEKVSTLLGMYSFLNRAQTFRPIESLNAKSPADIMTSLMKNGNIPVGKMLAQPLIANNMEKMMGSMAMNMMKNGGLNDLLKNGNLNDMLSSIAQSSDKGSQEGGNMDLNSLMETFMPIISNMSSNNSRNDGNDNSRNYPVNYENTPKKIEFKNESFLPDEDETEIESKEKSTENYTYNDKYDDYHDKPKNNRYDRNYKNERYDNYEKAVNYNEHKSNYNDRNDIQRPIRIKQRKRR